MDFLAESFDNPAPFTLTADTIPPQAFYASFDVNGKPYALSLIQTAVKGVYELDFGRRMNTNVKWSKYHSPKDVTQVIATMLEFTKGAIGHEHNLAMVRGVVFKVNTKAALIPRVNSIVKRIVRSKFQKDFSFVDVTYNDEKAKNSDGSSPFKIFVVRKGTNPASLFSGKKFSSVSFLAVDPQDDSGVSVSNDQPVPEGILDNLEKKKEKKNTVKTAVSRFSFQGKFSVDSNDILNMPTNTTLDAVMKGGYDTVVLKTPAQKSLEAGEVAASAEKAIEYKKAEIRDENIVSILDNFDLAKSEILTVKNMQRLGVFAAVVDFFLETMFIGRFKDDKYSQTETYKLVKFRTNGGILYDIVPDSGFADIGALNTNFEDIFYTLIGSTAITTEWSDTEDYFVAEMHAAISPLFAPMSGMSKQYMAYLKHAPSFNPNYSFVHAYDLLRELDIKVENVGFDQKNRIRKLIAPFASIFNRLVKNEQKTPKEAIKKIFLEFFSKQDGEFYKGYSDTLVGLRAFNMADPDNIKVPSSHDQATAFVSKKYGFLPHVFAFEKEVQVSASGRAHMSLESAPSDIIDTLVPSFEQSKVFGLGDDAFFFDDTGYFLQNKYQGDTPNIAAKDAAHAYNVLWNKNDYKKHIPTLKNFKALKSYTGSEYVQYNSTNKKFIESYINLKDGDGYAEYADANKIFQYLDHYGDKLFDVFEEIKPIKESFFVYRNLDYSDQYHKDLKVGDDYVDPRFLSTSINSFIGTGGSTMKMRIFIPKGSKVVPVLNHSQVPSEQEVVLPPMSYLRVVRVDKVMESPTSSKIEKMGLGCVYLGSAWSSIRKDADAAYKKEIANKNKKVTVSEMFEAKIAEAKKRTANGLPPATTNNEPSVEYDADGKFGGTGLHPEQVKALKGKTLTLTLGGKVKL